MGNVKTVSKKKPYLFYYEEAENAWCPAPDITEAMISTDNFDIGKGEYDTEDIIEIQFRVAMLTEEEFNNLPVI